MSALSPQAQKILMKAYTLRNEGKIQASFKQARAVAKKHADNLHVIYLLGTLYLEMGDYKKAVIQFKNGIKQDPQGHVNQAGLGTAYYKLGDYKEAIPLLELAHNRDPKELSHQRNLAFSLYDNLQLDAATKHFESVLLKQKDDIEVAEYLVSIHKINQDYGKAEQILRLSLKHNPNKIAPLENLASFILERGDTAELRQLNAEIKKLDPENIQAYFNDYSAAAQEGNKELIEQSLLKIETFKDQFTIGQKIDFVSFISKSGVKHPILLELKDRYFSDFTKLISNTKKLESLSAESLFNLANIFERYKEYDASFKILIAANEQKKKTNKILNRVFDRNHFEKYLEILEQFDQWSEIFKDIPSSNTQMTFICAMPRSGTTLVEQILAAHPACEGIGESKNLDILKHNLAKEIITFPPYLQWPEKYVSLPLSDKEKLATEFLEGAQNDLQNAQQNSQQDSKQAQPTRIIEKSIANFMYIGLLAALFPNAKFIYCRRHRAASGLSIYQQNFINPFLFDNDLDDINFMFDFQNHIMEFWQTKLPNRILTIDYEKLVVEPEYWAKTLIDHIDLEWDPACLEFYKQKKTVKTASLHQVRSQIYATSAEKFKQYKTFLAPLLG